MTGTPARVRCDRCGPRLVPLAQVRVLDLAGHCEYVFTCPGCGLRTRRPADAELLAVLRAAGAASLTLYSGEPDAPVGP